MCGKYAPVEWLKTWSSIYTPTLALIPYPVHGMQTTEESVYVTDMGVGLTGLY